MYMVKVLPMNLEVYKNRDYKRPIPKLLITTFVVGYLAMFSFGTGLKKKLYIYLLELANTKEYPRIKFRLK